MKKTFAVVSLAASVLVAFGCREAAPPAADEAAPGVVAAPSAVLDAAAVPKTPRDVALKGLEFLKKAQHADGHWEDEDGAFPLTTTALAGMAFFMSGKINDPHYPQNVHKAIDWICRQSQPQRGGLIYTGQPSEASSYMEGHGLATQLLKWCDNSRSSDFAADTLRPDQIEVCDRAIQYIREAASSQGGWHHTSSQEGHDQANAMSTVIQIHALQLGSIDPLSAKPMVNDGRKFLRSLSGRKPTQTPQMSKQKAEAENASLGAALCLTGWFPDDHAKAWMKANPPTTSLPIDVQRDAFRHYFDAQVVFTHNPAAWENYRDILFHALKTKQGNDGSWPPLLDAPEGIASGSVTATALWCVILQLDSGRHPLAVRPRW